MNIYSSVIECLIDRTNKPKWAEGLNYLTMAKRINRASTHPTVVLLGGLKTPIQTVAMSISTTLTVAIMSISRILSGYYEYFNNINSGYYEYFKNINSGYYELLSGAREYVSGA